MRLSLTNVSSAVHGAKALPFWYGNIDEQDLQKLVRQCRPHRRGFCLRTGKKHVILRGGCPGTGKPMTHFAAAYPPPLNTMLGRILVDQVRMDGNEFEALQQDDCQQWSPDCDRMCGQLERWLAKLGRYGPGRDGIHAYRAPGYGVVPTSLRRSCHFKARHFYQVLVGRTT